MSAIRKAPGVYVDPHTGEEFRPDPLPVRGSGPVEVVRQPYAPAPARPAAQELLTADEIRERHVKGALAAQAARKRKKGSSA